jgi:phosphoglycerol transferase MdoB-like AlkP superfamily enzyme
MNQTFKNQWLLLLFFAMLPLLSYQYSNVDYMEFSHNSYANELSGNGLFSFAAAARRNELDYVKFYKTIPQAQADRILAAHGVKRMPLSPQNHTNFTKTTNSVSQPAVAHPFKRAPKNIVLISVESLSAEYLGTYGNQENLTPYLDALAKESLVFDRAFATGTRTVRGLDALSIGTPPIPGQAIVHRPNNMHLATIGEFLEVQHYATFFIYGGYGMFDNMNKYFRGNDYRVIDRTDFDKRSIQSENIWGVDDESLFSNTLAILDKQTQSTQPFFTHVMTTSNHRPFTFPAGKIDLPQGNRAGAVKYTDYAIGQFIQKAKHKPWFNDTLFVIVADHCASVAGKTKLPVAKYHIPLFFYAPDLLPAGHYQRMVSQIDIPPTLISLLGTKGADQFFGQNIWAAENKHMPERAFISNYQSLGYYKNDQLIVLSPKQKVEAFHIAPITYESTPIAVDKDLATEAIAYYQTASRAYKTGDLSEFAHSL